VLRRTASAALHTWPVPGLSAKLSITRSAFPGRAPSRRRSDGFVAEQVWNGFPVRVGTSSQASPAFRLGSQRLEEQRRGFGEDVAIQALLPGTAPPPGRHLLHRKDLSGDEGEHAHQGRRRAPGTSPLLSPCVWYPQPPKRSSALKRGNKAVSERHARRTRGTGAGETTALLERGVAQLLLESQGLRHRHRGAETAAAAALRHHNQVEGEMENTVLELVQRMRANRYSVARMDGKVTYRLYQRRAGAEHLRRRAAAGDCSRTRLQRTTAGCIRSIRWTWSGSPSSSPSSQP